MGGSVSFSKSGRATVSEKLELEWAAASFQGKRETHEDCVALEPDLIPNKLHAFSVFDGHYGDKAAKLASKTLHRILKEHIDEKGNDAVEEALKSAFSQTDQEILQAAQSKEWDDGSTGLLALITGGDPSDTCEPVLYIANAGDCRAVVYRGEGKIDQVTVDHSTQNKKEAARITASGGALTMGRIEGKLNVARGFGDRSFKTPKPLVISEPDVFRVALAQEAKQSKSDKKSKKASFAEAPIEFLILASDGIWGWISNEQVAKLVRRRLREEPESEKDAKKKLLYICEDLIHLAMDSGSTDNISVILIVFNRM